MKAELKKAELKRAKSFALIRLLEASKRAHEYAQHVEAWKQCKSAHCKRDRDFLDSQGVTQGMTSRESHQ